MTVPVIIDTDPGVDDAVALMLAAASPELQLLAVTTVFGNVGVEVATANALRLRALARLGQLPVASGAAQPLVPPRGQQRAQSKHGADGLSGRAGLLPGPIGPVDPRGAVALMAELLSDATDPVTLVAIGPLTNIALLLTTRPEAKPRIGRIVIMGGYLGGPSAESNIGSDPEAAHRVLVEQDVPTTLVPLDLTLRAAVGGAWLAGLAAAGPRCAVLADVIEDYRERLREAWGHDTVALHDPLAVLEAAVPGTLRTTSMPLEVVCDHGPTRGAVAAGRSQRASSHVVQVALDADLPSVNATILNRLRSLR